ncbi:DUF5315 domain-containing protein [Aspergillus glaucus CBS 516.65]|uniref:Uncharacterized protein n=1 Tax=Aspergillus glaucus CBS 516.65 TaxID=1160497 RepID=A0A1L9VHK3_ASPGL|nr:hypothetical protein ASPGLDRAFT_127711 [Aspergillus glaucus CBS 516.65]OJJ83363.1 hypothetical protein ASPGLDRAFT_127711 [Aspergillus glaucus CBS 516.65]
MASTSKDSPHHLRKISSQRLPPPSLFQGPPSHNASNLSLAQPPSNVGSRGASQPPPLQRSRTPRAHDSFSTQSHSLSPFRSRAQSKGEVDSSDAIWQEMQSALSEVELSAVTREHVFGEKHSEALEDLRRKQLTLAQAWARSEADEVVDTSERRPSLQGQSQNPNVTAEDINHRNLDEETERDILLARERREANDRYFDRVNNGVLDVVAKLEEVAQAMRAVERESKDIWSDTDSMTTTTTTTTAPSTTNAGGEL